MSLTSYDLQQAIKELEASDFLVFGEYVKRKIKFDEGILDWNVTVLRVVRSTNPFVIRMAAKKYKS